MFERNGNWKRRRASIHGRRSRPQNPSPSAHRPTPPPQQRRRATRPIRILRRCSSEPAIWTVRSLEKHTPGQTQMENQVLLFRPQTCSDVLDFPHLRSPSPSPLSFQRYREDSKVLVNVTVEGSPGPVRTMVNLGSSVEDTIKLVIDRYREEGRSPRLDPGAVSVFELHHSHFSLESLNKTDRIGDTGSRNFFLRKSCSSHSSNSENDAQRRGGGGESEVANSNPAMVPPEVFFSFIARRISKIGRRTRKIWKVLGCMVCE